jgi:hypothetical protein
MKKKIEPVGHNVVALRPGDTTPEIALRDALERVQHYKNCVVVMLDQDDVPSLFSTSMSAAQFSLAGLATQNFAMAIVLGAESPTEYKGADDES